MEDGRAGGRGAKESKSGEIKRDQAEQEAVAAAVARRRHWVKVDDVVVVVAG